MPEGKKVVANGELISQRTRRGWTTWHWSEDSPMASYLSTATKGIFLTEQYEAEGLFMYDAGRRLALRGGPPGACDS